MGAPGSDTGWRPRPDGRLPAEGNGPRIGGPKIGGVRGSAVHEVMLREPVDYPAAPDGHHGQGAAFVCGCRAEPLAALVEPDRTADAVGYLTPSGEPLECEVAPSQDDAGGVGDRRHVHASLCQDPASGDGL